MAKGNPVLPVPLGGFALAALGLALHYGFRARRARMVNDPPGLSPPDAPAGGGEQAGDSAPPGPV
ncbi:MAG: hypothetical protein QMC81_00745 [Thermoanaerobacterales bacterium]|nr:hypothetical protein [Thermoanaerobacterales bacterium]